MIPLKLYPLRVAPLPRESTVTRFVVLVFQMSILVKLSHPKTIDTGVAAVAPFGKLTPIAVLAVIVPPVNEPRNAYVFVPICFHTNVPVGEVQLVNVGDHAVQAPCVAAIVVPLIPPIVDVASRVPELIVLFVNVSVVARPTSVSDDVGNVNVPVFEIVEMIGDVKVLFVNV